MIRWARALGIIAGVFIVAYFAVTTVQLKHDLERKGEINCHLGTALRTAINDSLNGEVALGIDPKTIVKLRAYATVPSPYCK